MPWEKQYDETAVLDRAMRAFWARGYAATSMSDLVDATGINRGSIYAAFTDKRGLFTRALQHYDRVHRSDFLEGMAEAHGPKEAILATFEAAAASGRDGTTPGGCLLVNTALELSPHDPEIAAVVSRALCQVERFFRDRVAAARDAGSVPARVDADATAKALLGLFLGLRVLTRSNAEEETLNAILSQARRMLG